LRFVRDSKFCEKRSRNEEAVWGKSHKKIAINEICYNNREEEKRKGNIMFIRTRGYFSLSVMARGLQKGNFGKLINNLVKTRLWSFKKN
jgi:hypothetical protein